MGVPHWVSMAEPCEKGFHWNEATSRVECKATSQPVFEFNKPPTGNIAACCELCDGDGTNTKLLVAWTMRGKLGTSNEDSGVRNRWKKNLVLALRLQTGKNGECIEITLNNLKSAVSKAIDPGHQSKVIEQRP